MCGTDISIHAPRAGSDRLRQIGTQIACHFNPRSPCGERPESEYGSITARIFQSTLPVRGATLQPLPESSQPCISIHAPRAGSDVADRRDLQIQKISIHAPRAGSDMVYVDNGKDYRGFQSTLPVRGATGHLCHNALPELISIHAPRAGSVD